MSQGRAQTNLKTSYDMPTVDCLQVAGRSTSPADHGQNPPSISPHGKTSLKVRLDDIRGRRDNDRGRRNTRRSRSRSRLWSRGSDIRNGGATPYHGASAEAGSQRDTGAIRATATGQEEAGCGWREQDDPVTCVQDDPCSLFLRRLRQVVQPFPGDSGVPARDKM